MESDLELVQRIMLDFAARTGLDPVSEKPRRYLWTDAFAVCNFLELHRQTEEKRHLDLAIALVDQVHRTLGRHRADDSRSGWISGLDEKSGEEHPTIGGLRIGKPLPERAVDEPPDEELEWEQDGQYYHYLTKWMHALSRLSIVSDETKYAIHGIELARAAHKAFAYTPVAGGRRRMYWKMSIDLSRPLVPSMGLHDPLDGYVTYLELQTIASRIPALSELNLKPELADMATICRGGSWVTDDPLGIGGLLFDASRIGQLMVLGAPDHSRLLRKVLDSAQPGVESFSIGAALCHPAQYRLAFRELGLSLGLKAVERLNALAKQHPEVLDARKDLVRRTMEMMSFASVGTKIERFWTEPTNRTGSTWIDHQDINAVML
ncbi:MAG: hypothetical protein LUO85_05105, partial [Methanomassiliicoccales archaeon]|nr:hypothetical protein [Methanomassiliicoccales archaeon]